MPQTIPPAEPGIFDYQNHVRALAARQTSLDRLQAVITWKSFSPLLAQVFRLDRQDRGGRPRYEPLLMLKIVVLQRIHNLSDEATELAVQERLTWHRFLDLHVGSQFPDAKTIWAFRDQLIKAGAMERLFEIFHQQIAARGFRLEPGKIVDATIVPVPIQRNRPEENQQIKAGITPPGWANEPEKLRQKDVDARWTMKNGRSWFGYKNHIKVDARTKLIETCVVTPANTHDSQVADRLVAAQDGWWHGDSAYNTCATATILSEAGVESRCHRQGRGTRLLTEQERAENRAKSTVRARVEHIFGSMRTQLNGVFQRCRGFQRNQQMIWLTNLVYNMQRFRHLVEAR